MTNLQSHVIRISQLTELISKKPIPPHVKDLTLEVMAEDEEGEDVEVSEAYIFAIGLGQKEG